MTPIRKFFRLSESRRVLLVIADVLFFIFSLLLRIGSVKLSKRFARWLSKTWLSRWSVKDANWALSVVDSYRTGSGGCLPAALVALAITDESLELRFGVEDDDDSIRAHAWAEGSDGQLLYAGADPAEFQRLRPK